VCVLDLRESNEQFAKVAQGVKMGVVSDGQNDAQEEAVLAKDGPVLERYDLPCSDGQEIGSLGQDR